MLKLKQLRIDNNLTQKEFAKLFNITQGTYSNYENETTQPDIKLLIEIANKFNVSVDYLIGRNYYNELGYLNEQQKMFVQSFLALNTANQMNAVIYVSSLLANQ